MHAHSTRKRASSATAKRHRPPARRIVTAGATIAYRTVSQPRSAAEATRRMFAANPHFLSATLRPSRKAGFYFVALVPANPARLDDMFGAFAGQRITRAKEESPWWAWGEGDKHVATPHWHQGAIIWHTYGQDADGWCECPDSQHRCKPLRERCKHMIEREIRAAEREAERNRAVQALNETGFVPGDPEAPGALTDIDQFPIPVRDIFATTPSLTPEQNQEWVRKNREVDFL